MNMGLLRASVLLSAAVVGLACGPSVENDDASDTGSETSGGTQDDGATTSPLTCEAVASEASTPVRFMVRNTGTDPIYLDQASCAPPVDLLGPDRAVSRWRFPDCNLAACEALLQGDCGISCADCASGVIRVAPGATYQLDWDGTVFVDVEAPPQCTPATCDAQCHRQVAAAPGTYRLETRVHLDCPFAELRDCDCPAGEDVCAIFVYAESPPEAQTFSAEFDYAAETTVVMTVP
jgi:hypothetical protein